MTRTLRRSQIHDWDPGLGNQASSIMTPRSAERIDAVVPLEPVAPAPSARQIAAAAGHATDTVVAPRRQRRGLYILAAVTLAAIIGVAFSFAHDAAPTAAVPTAAAPLKPIDHDTPPVPEPAKLAVDAEVEGLARHLDHAAPPLGDVGEVMVAAEFEPDAVHDLAQP